ncbi:hypothetical protein BpHYR1_026029, partial [Brachionus plicatilis]
QSNHNKGNSKISSEEKFYKSRTHNALITNKRIFSIVEIFKIIIFDEFALVFMMILVITFIFGYKSKEFGLCVGIKIVVIGCKPLVKMETILPNTQGCFEIERLLHLMPLIFGQFALLVIQAENSSFKENKHNNCHLAIDILFLVLIIFINGTITLEHAYAFFLSYRIYLAEFDSLKLS